MGIIIAHRYILFGQLFHYETIFFKKMKKNAEN